MQDIQTYLGKLQKDAIDCALIGKRATDPEKEQLFGQLAENLALLAADLERAIESDGGQCLMRSAAFRGPRTLVSGKGENRKWPLRLAFGALSVRSRFEII
jgi:hypothetical protein